MISLSLLQTSFGFVVLLTAVNSLVLLALVRQVGILLLRVGQVVPANANGLSPGMSLDIPALVATVGPEDTRQKLLVFVTAECGACRSIVPAANEVARRYAEIDVSFVADSIEEEARAWGQTMGLQPRIIATSGILKDFGIPGTPYACVLDDSFHVLKAGGVNHLDHLETLIHSCSPISPERHGAMLSDGDGRLQAKSMNGAGDLEG
jgi:thiol-disulfide isomerase/thioredoxin